MECVKGSAISKGLAYGKLFVYKEPDIRISAQKTADVEKELRRFSDARKKVRKNLVHIMNKNDDNDVLSAHIAIVDDVIFEEMVESYINKNASAECAVLLVRNELCKTFEAMTDEYLRERSLDIKDVGNRIIREILGINDEINLEENVIFMGYELTPSQALNIDRDKLLGFVTESGGVNSHTAILAREKSIPAVSGIEVSPELAGKMVLVDGYEGCMYIEPSKSFVNELMTKHNKVVGFDWSAVENRPKLYANISSLAEAEAAAKKR